MERGVGSARADTRGEIAAGMFVQTTNHHFFNTILVGISKAASAQEPLSPIQGIFPAADTAAQDVVLPGCHLCGTGFMDFKFHCGGQEMASETVAPTLRIGDEQS